MTVKGFEYNAIHQIYDLLELLESCIAFKRFMLVVVYGRNRNFIRVTEFHFARYSSIYLDLDCAIMRCIMYHGTYYFSDIYST